MVRQEKESKEEIMYGERAIETGSLICFPNPNINRDYEISIDFPEFTCKCPFSGYPDFATLRIKYQPNTKVIELKSVDAGTPIENLAKKNDLNYDSIAVEAEQIEKFDFPNPPQILYPPIIRFLTSPTKQKI